MKNLSRKEAAKILEDMKVKVEISKAAVTQLEWNIALDMAIEALKYSGVDSSDCIIRQDAINLLKKWSDGYKYIETETESAIKEFQRLPSAEPEPSQVARDIATIIENEKDMRVIASAQPKNGKWIESGYNHYEAVCSECGEPCATYVMGKPRDKYCKWCGAKMNTEEEEGG